MQPIDFAFDFLKRLFLFLLFIFLVVCLFVCLFDITGFFVSNR